ncbi:MAG: threonine/serine exporter family protein [Clostridia bacterium]|nr:threonine/serine exporter family protein [Clostridia bacterium]
MTLEFIGRAIIIFLSSSLGTLGFAIFMHAPKKAWVPASAIGGLGYLIYWALNQFGLYAPMSMFIGALLSSVLAQYCARRMRMIATIFLILSIIPLVPGLGLYRCMHYLAQEMYSEGADAGVRAMVDIVMIALALGVGSYLFRMVALRHDQHIRGGVRS